MSVTSNRLSGVTKFNSGGVTSGLGGVIYQRPIEEMPNLKLFLQSKSLPLGALEQWNDLSGNGNHAAQTTGSYQPEVVENSAGRKVVRFGGDDFMDIASGLIYNQPSATIICVHSRTARPTSSNVVFIAPESNTTGFIFRYASTSTNYIRTGARMLKNDSIITALSTDKNPALGDTVYAIATAQQNGNVTLIQQGVSDVITSGLTDNPFTAGSSPATTIGASWRNDATPRADFFVGDIELIAVYDRALSAGEILQWQRYIEANYATV